MTDKQRSVLVGVVFSLGGVLVAGIAVAVVRARVHRRPVEGPTVPPPPASVTDDETEPAAADHADPTADLPADMRPEDPSYGPLI